MTSAGAADKQPGAAGRPEGEDVQKSEDRQVSQGLFFASLTAGALGLFVGLILLLGPRGVVLTLGVVAVVLALISYRRSVADSERSGAVGSMVLGLATCLIGILVAAH